MERGGPSKQGVSAGPRPLVLDLRAPADFEPVSIVNAITINLPTLLMRRYRKGGAVSAFALESFITMPADKELFHLIQDGWRQDLGQDGVEVTHDVVVLDQDMKTGKEEYGRSPSSAWTLVSVLERGGGNLGGAIRLWYLEGGFDAFQAWDVGAKHLTQPDSEMGVTQDGQQPTQPENQGESKSMPLSLPSNSTPAPYLDPQTAQAISNAVSMTTASLGGQTTRQRGAPARRESLFSLNTKSLQRPAGLSRSQTVGMGALNIKPLSIAPALPTLPATQEDASATGDGPAHPPLKNQSGWLTVPNGGGAPTTPSLSPAMSLNNNSSMDISQSASPDRSSAWSASSSGDGPSGSQGPKLGSKKSFSSTITVFSLNQSGVPKGIQEEDEGEEAPQSSSGNSGNPGHLRRYHSEATYGGPYDGNGDSQGLLQSRSFADGIDSYNNNFASGNLMSQHYGYDDENGDDGGDNGEQEISCILPNFLYLGPEIATEQQVQELERLGIKRVLNMARECEDLLVVNRPGIEYHKVGVQDHVEADVTAGFMQAVDIIAASNDSPIYVHCKAGKSRSVTAIIAYLITQLHWPLNKAYQHVLTQRPCMCPNIGFVTELMRMEERTLGGNERSGLARAGSLNSILSLSTAGSGGQSHHHHHHHSLQPHHSKGAAGSPKVLSSKSSVNNLGVLSPPFQQQLTDNGPVPAPLQSAI
ncbi:hypothetical protein BGX31_008579 [Mortierella sp. GBA43]|nr:hypothetical protein BGX31_008579 [Mortierella sp. GBA43]